MTSSAPPTPQAPATTVQQSQDVNRNTAIATQGINSTNQITPQGNLTYSQIGTWPDGTPQFSATTTLSPEQQNLYNQYTANQQKLGAIGGEQLDKVGSILGTPFDLNSAANNQQTDIARRLLDPTWAAQEGQLDTKLANQGIPLGSEARTLAMRDFGMQRANAYDQMLLQGRAQAVSEALANRNQPLNEISALMNGSQISQPNFAQTPTTNVAPTNVGGIMNDAYQGQLQAYGIQQGARNAMVGGGAGLFGTAITPLSYAYGRSLFGVPTRS